MDQRHIDSILVRRLVESCAPYTTAAAKQTNVCVPNDNRIQTNVPLLFVLYFVRLIVNRNRNLISVKFWARNRCVCFFSLLSPLFF